MNIPRWLHFYAGSFSYTSPAVFIWEVSLTQRMLASFSNPGSFSYTSRAGFNFISWLSLTHPMLVTFFTGGVFLTHPALASFLSGEFLLYIPCCFYLGSFSYTSHADFFFSFFFFSCGVSLTQPVLPSFLSGSFSYTSHDDVNFIWGFSLTHPVLASFLSGVFLLHIPCWL